MALTSAELTAAQTIVNGWEWQVAEGHNYRWAKATKTLIRFHESAPMESDEFRLVLEYLRTQEGVESIVLNQKSIALEGTWNAKDAWYQTANGDKFEGADTYRVRIYQALVGKDDTSDADGPYTVENGCQYKVEHTFYWDVETIPTLPASSSGIQYTLQGVTRDRETGYFSCVIEKRTRVQQDVALYGQAVTAFERVQEEQHLGVMASKVNTTGKAASVSNGVKTTRQITKNSDCTSDIRNVVTTETPVKGAVMSARKTLRGTTVTTTDRSQAAALAMTGLAIGEERRSEETEGKLWNNTVVQTAKEAAGKIAESCDQRTTEHQHETLTNVATDPGSPETTAGTNVVRRKSVRRTEEGTYDVTETTEQYNTVRAATTSGTSSRTERTTVAVNATAIPTRTAGVNEQVDISAQPNDHGSYGITQRLITYKPDSRTVTGGTVSRTEVTTTGVNQTAIPAATPAVNQQVDVSASINDHGSMSTQKRVITYKPDSKTVTGGTVSRTEVTTTGVNQTSVPTGATGTNQQCDISVSMNDHGSMSTQKRQTTYHAVTKTATSSWATERVKTTVTVNGTSSPSATMGEASVSPNDHGSATTQVSVHTPIAVDSGWKTWTSTNVTPSRIFTYEHGLRCFVNLTTLPTPPSAKDSNVTFSINRFGRYDGHMSYTKLKKWEDNTDSVTTLAWEKTFYNQTAKVFYTNKSGKLCYRVFTCEKLYKCYGPYRSVFEKSANGENCAPAGWISGTTMHGVDNAFGVKYTGISVGAEQVVDNDESSSSSS